MDIILKNIGLGVLILVAVFCVGSGVNNLPTIASSGVNALPVFVQCALLLGALFGLVVAIIKSITDSVN